MLVEEGCQCSADKGLLCLFLIKVGQDVEVRMLHAGFVHREEHTDAVCDAVVGTGGSVCLDQTQTSLVQYDGLQIPDLPGNVGQVQHDGTQVVGGCRFGE